MLKEADEVVGALSALFGGGSQGLNLGNMTFANPGMAGMLTGMSSENPGEGLPCLLYLFGPTKRDVFQTLR